MGWLTKEDEETHIVQRGVRNGFLLRCALFYDAKRGFEMTPSPSPPSAGAYLARKVLESSPQLPFCTQRLVHHWIFNWHEITVEEHSRTF